MIPAAIIGIGKFGGRELTTGSDLDLFVVYERAGWTDGASPVEAHVFYDRVVEKLSELLGDITSAGIVFPVDLRLRPGSKGSGFATSLDAVEQYYLEWADPWERQTLTRARLVGGDPRLGRTLRKRLDALVYGPGALPPDLKEMRGLRDRMEKELGKESPGRLHVKFGRGGLVDVEFITQAVQMLHGRQRSDRATREHDRWRSRRSRRPGSCRPTTATRSPSTIGSSGASRPACASSARALRMRSSRPGPSRAAWRRASTIPRARSSSRTIGAARPGCARSTIAWCPDEPADARARSTPKETIAVSERLFVLDGPGYLYRAYHALPYLSNSKGMAVHAVFGMSTMLWKLLREESPEYFAVAWDPPGPTFREERFAAYKEQRPSMPDDLRSQIAYVKKLFEALRLPLLEVAGFEADDVLGTLVERARDLPVDIVLVTADKDMLQLVGPKVRVLAELARTGQRVVYDEIAVKEKWGVGPEQIPDLLALMGDSIDNIPGVPGVGEKTAVKLITQFGSVERLYENLHLIAGKLRETLAQHRQTGAPLARAGHGEHARADRARPRGLEAAGAGLGATATALGRARVLDLAAPAPGRDDRRGSARRDDGSVRCRGARKLPGRRSGRCPHRRRAGRARAARPSQR